MGLFSSIFPFQISIVTWGRTSDVPFNEESPIGEHTTEYAKTKYEGDKVARDLYKQNFRSSPSIFIYSKCNGEIQCILPNDNGKHHKTSSSLGIINGYCQQCVDRIQGRRLQSGTGFRHFLYAGAEGY